VTTLATIAAMTKPRVFVAYPYSFSKADYRRAFREVGKAYGVTFTYADEKITNKQILEKIEGMIEEAEFSIFDVTTWNPNVALELGIVRGKGADYYILFNPKSDQGDVPSDLGGIDRLQYTDYTQLSEEVSRLMRQQFGAPSRERDEAAKARGAQVTEHLEEIKNEIPLVVKREPGMAIGGIASTMGVPVEVAKPLVRDLVSEDKLQSEGVRRGTKYYPHD
jgi:predicted nucleotide-binding protein